VGGNWASELDGKQRIGLKEHTSSTGKSAGQVMSGVHVTTSLPSSRRVSTSVAALHREGLNLGRATAITDTVLSHYAALIQIVKLKDIIDDEWRDGLLWHSVSLENTLQWSRSRERHKGYRNMVWDVYNDYVHGHRFLTFSRRLQLSDPWPP